MKLFLSRSFFALFILSAILLVAAVALQTSKSEGLTGMVGGKVEATPFLRKRTWDEKLDRLTGVLAWSFLVLSTAIVLFTY